MTTGVAGTVLSLMAMFLVAACCGRGVLPEDSPVIMILRVPCLPGAWAAQHVDRSGGWPSLYAFAGTSFAVWAMFGACMTFTLNRLLAARRAGPE